MKIIYSILFAVISALVLVSVNLHGETINNEYDIGLMNNTDFTEVWIIPTDVAVRSPPTAADINRDGKLEILIGDDGGYLHCIDFANRRILWNNSFGSQIFGAPIAADLDADNNLEILFGTLDGFLYCLDNEGSYKWHVETGDSKCNSPVIVDFDNDNKKEIIIGSYNGSLYCINYNGELRWKNSNFNHIDSAPAITDFDDNGQYDIIIQDSTYGLYFVNETGHETGMQFIPSYKSPTVADINLDGEIEILAGNKDGRLHCLDENSDEIWNTNLYLAILNIPAIGNVDESNDYLEIITNFQNTINCTDYIGNNLWGTTYAFDLTSSPVLADIRSVGKLDIIIGSEDGILCLDYNGNIAAEYITNARVESTPLIANIDDDISGSLEIIFGCNTGIYCIRHKATVVRELDAPWYCYHGSIFHTGNIDSDNDLLDDISERMYNTNVIAQDTDNDNLKDGNELLCCTDPNDDDTDNDGLFDGDEVRTHGTNPHEKDTDSDGIDDDEELIPGLDGYTTNPLDDDTDNDDLIDGDEVNEHGTSPVDSDSDDDGLDDYEEVIVYGTNPWDSDTDNDGIDDQEEVALGVDGYSTNPNNNDTDNDGLSDYDEINTYFTDPTNVDSDDDGLSDRDEIITHYTDPLDSDSDDDTLLDGEEVNIYFTNPLDDDSDDDGLTDGVEITKGTDPNDSDTDGDGIKDNWEIAHGWDANQFAVWLYFGAGPSWIYVIILTFSIRLIRRRFGRISILLLSANPRGNGLQPLKPENEFNMLLEAIKGKYQYKFKEPIHRHNINGDKVQEIILNIKPDILHINCHGEEDKILFENDDRMKYEYPHDKIVDILKKIRRDTKLVYLSVCKSNMLAEELSKSIKFVIGMKDPTEDITSRKFAKGFYNAIANGCTIDEAKDLGLRNLSDSDQADKPMLYVKKSKSEEKFRFVGKLRIKKKE